MIVLHLIARQHPKLLKVQLKVVQVKLLTKKRPKKLQKALTALALVFAIFDLNPAPFCLLDEVDAPLDDLNTLRFINMVEEMSKTVQFIFITHNKVSMERSDYLMGVTMQEAGVSRMVSVDVNQALELAES